MNKTDMWKAAQEAEKLGVDPDTVMVTYTLDEFAKSHGDEVDTFDEDKEEIRTLEAELFEISEVIEDVQAEITKMSNRVSSSRNWAEKYELGQEIRDTERELSDLQREARAITARLNALRHDFDQKYAKIDTETIEEGIDPRFR